MVNKFRFNHRYTIITIFLIGILIRLGFSLTMPGALSNDAHSYYRASVNLVNGNGYSACEEPPYHTFFFREPLTALSFALPMWMYKTAHGIDKLDYPTSWTVKDMQPHHQTIIQLIKFQQNLLSVLALLFIYLALKQHASKQFSTIFLAIGAIYMPLILYSTLILREPYIFFLLSVFAWSWEKYIRLQKLKWLSISAIIMGINCMYLHLYSLILLFIIPIIICRQWNNSKVIKITHIFTFTILMFIPSVPWIGFVYSKYPNIRIIKTMGVALNAEYTNCLNAYRALGYDPYYVKQGDIPGNVEVRTDIFCPKEESKIFDYTFDGTYSREAARINSHNTTSQIIKYYSGRIVEAFRNTVFIVGITYDYGVFHGKFSGKDLAKFVLVSPFILFGILALCSVYPIIKKYWMFLPVFLYHACFFFAYGDEERRQYIIVPYIIIFGLVTIKYTIKQLRKSNE